MWRLTFFKRQKLSHLIFCFLLWSKLLTEEITETHTISFDFAEKKKLELFDLPTGIVFRLIYKTTTTKMYKKKQQWGSVR